MKRSFFSFLSILALAPSLGAGTMQILPDGTAFIDAGAVLRREISGKLELVSQAQISQRLQELVEALPEGGAIHLPDDLACGTLDLRRAELGLQITGGTQGELVIGPGQQGLRVLFSKMGQRIEAGSSEWLPVVTNQLWNQDAVPTSDLLALFCEGAVKIKSDVRNCTWIAAQNGFGDHVVTADARVDESLFLWIGANWPFRDYNAHWDPERKGQDWNATNAQSVWNLHGGGQGTRIYEYIETGYGNPGAQLILEDAAGVALYHGSTERNSSQGPGVYWLKNCRDCQVGLRALNPFMRNDGNPRAPCANHDLTIDGGSNNILQGLRAWGYCENESAINRSAGLQCWSVYFAFETKGFDQPDVFKFAFTPEAEMPTGAALAERQRNAQEVAKRVLATRRKAAEEMAKKSHADKVKKQQTTAVAPAETEFTETPERIQHYADLHVRGRFAATEIGALKEEAMAMGSVDLTKPEAKLSRKLPPVPKIPATQAPDTNLQLAFTQTPEFGQALLKAGADPTGKQPSDDALAQVMFGLKRAQVEAALQETYAGDAAFRKAREPLDALKKQLDPELRAAQTNADQAAEATLRAKVKAAEEAMAGALNIAKAQIKAGMDKLLAPEDPQNKGRRPSRGRLEFPAGTFLFKHPIVLVGNHSEVFGAGPERTILKTTEPIKLMEQHDKCHLANFTLEGGRVGLAITGADHGDAVAPTLHSYVAGMNYFRLTFRNQSFAGMHLGGDDPELLGGAEHDQNKYVNLKFERTGDYGIFMNMNMLDKWLCLHSEFVGQRQAGIAIKFNNLIHGAVIGCKFSEINGPGIDVLGGNPEIGYRPWACLIDQCEFLECGNATMPAVEHGYGELFAFLHSKIITKTKPVLTGYRGAAQVYEDVEIDVKTTTAEAPVIFLRSARNATVTRPNGHTLRNVRTNGPVAFSNDANAYNAMFAKTMEAKGLKLAELDWDANPAAHELAPKSGWTHPFVFYRCDFGGKKYAYSLLNVDIQPGAANVTAEVDLSGRE